MPSNHRRTKLSSWNGMAKGCNRVSMVILTTRAVFLPGFSIGRRLVCLSVPYKARRTYFRAGLVGRSRLEPSCEALL